MRKILELLGTALLVVGCVGVIRELTGGWFAFLGVTRVVVEHLPVLRRDFPLFAHALLAVAGCGVLIAAGRRVRA
ncbi:hypothetical protein [Streptomyces thermolilacinus]|uniref:Uncharacterized protein n=1 Tax=Streptomyces thermolilacinus SPC6 TaxID=1306406 RepID=A0A1D3DMY6_9ACTN|nr:hypothetical protein [Streptomyces thermolilacinus]OEJ93694.1 hypothetical protein J116_003620 [Streptomyces thermolilacinus SPC6]